MCTENAVNLAAPGESACGGRTIGRTLADMCNVLNPETVIVGGELALPGGALTDGIAR